MIETAMPTTRPMNSMSRSKGWKTWTNPCARLINATAFSSMHAHRRHQGVRHFIEWRDAGRERDVDHAHEHEHEGRARSRRSAPRPVSGLPVVPEIHQHAAVDDRRDKEAEDRKQKEIGERGGNGEPDQPGIQFRQLSSKPRLALASLASSGADFPALIALDTAPQSAVANIRTRMIFGHAPGPIRPEACSNSKLSAWTYKNMPTASTTT